MKKQTTFLMTLISILFCLYTSRAFAQSLPAEPTTRLGAGMVRDIAYSPNGELMALAGNSGISCYQTDDRTKIGQLTGHTSWVESVAFSADGKTLVSGSRDGTARLWEVENQTEIAQLQGHKEEVFSVEFSPDGRFLASMSAEGGCPTAPPLAAPAQLETPGIRLWELETQQQISFMQNEFFSCF